MFGEKSSVQLLEKLVCNEDLLPTVTRRGNGKEEPPSRAMELPNTEN